MQRISVSPQVNFTDEQLETQKLSMWSCLAHLITPAVNRVVEFAKRVPSKIVINSGGGFIHSNI